MYNNKNVHKMLNRDDSDLLSKKKKNTMKASQRR